jgi:catechol 2,3-dioxygenase-like lactoylglutathione lyase family enzyme
MHITELILKTSSLKRTRLFYHKTLELDIIAETENKISFNAGHTKLTFEETPNEKPFYHFAFNVTNNRFSDCFEWIGNKLDILPVDKDGMLIAGYEEWNAQSFYFLDNNGSILELISRFDLPYYSSQPVSSKDIIEVSEIGLVTKDVQGLCDVLHKDDKIPYFVKGPKLEDFVAMGDDHGLLLVTQQGRGWIPNNKPAQQFPIIVISGGNFELQLP